MDSQNIKQLLEKFWNGETTAEEEAKVKAYRKSHPEAFEKEEAFYFDQLDSFSELSLGADFTENFMEGIAEETPSKKVRFLWYRNIAAAVILLLTMSVAFYSWNNYQETKLAEERATKEAFEQAKQALALISAKLNKGAEITYSLDKFSTAQEKIKTEKLN